MAKAQQPQRVSAANFIRGFASWRVRAARNPVVVTHHGKDAHVLISLDDYRRLDGHSPDAPGHSLEASQARLVESIRDAVILIDRQRRVAAINPAATDMLELSAAAAIGEPLESVVPRVAGSPLYPHILRLLDHRARFSGDVAALTRPRQWLHVDLVPVPIGGAIILRDVTASVDAAASSSCGQAAMLALEANGTIGQARLSVREMIEAANDCLVSLIGSDAAAIRRVRFSALLASGHRHGFIDALESVFRSGEPACVATELITRGGGCVPVRLSIAELRGTHASEGAVVLVTRRGDA